MAAAKKQINKVKLSQYYDVIKAPIVTEKATIMGEHNQYAFYVAIDADKPLIKAAVEAIFDVTVTAVNTVRMQGKVKRFRGYKGKRDDFKKAYVTLKQGDTIELATAG